MFGMKHNGCDERWAAGRHGRFRHHGRGHGGGRHGHGGDDTRHAGRMLAQGELRLLTLALIAEQPRHGYEIIKVLEDKTAGWYAPSPGIVYPTLTYLEDVGYLTAETAGSKRLYSITAEGRTYLESNRALVDAAMERLEAAGQRVNSRRDKAEDGRPRVPRLVGAALDNLRDAATERLRGDPDREAKVVEVLARAAIELRKS